MSARYRMAFVGLLSVSLATVFSPAPAALAGGTDNAGGGPGESSHYYAPYGDISGNDAAAHATVSSASKAAESTPQQIASEGSEFYTQGLAAFRAGNYGNASRLAAHAAIDEPRNPEVHVLAMLGLFAMGDYRGSAMEAHAVAAISHIPDWAKLYSIYQNPQPYTDQLRKLEKFVDQHPTAAEGRFLLGFQYMMIGQKNAARDEFLAAVRLTPRDKLADKLLAQEGGVVPSGISPRPEPGPSRSASKKAMPPAPIVR